MLYVYCAWVCMCLVCCRSGVSLSLWLSSSLISQHSQELICQQAAPVTHTINSLRTESEQTNTHTPKCVHTRLKTLAYTSIHTHSLPTWLLIQKHTLKLIKLTVPLLTLKHATLQNKPQHTHARTHTPVKQHSLSLHNHSPPPPHYTCMSGHVHPLSIIYQGFFSIDPPHFRFLPPSESLRAQPVISHYVGDVLPPSTAYW